MAKILTSLSLPRAQYDAMNEKSNRTRTSKSVLFTIGADLVCNIPPEVIERATKMAALLNTDPNTIILNMLTARVAQMEIARNSSVNVLESFPEIKGRRMDFSEILSLLK